MKTTQIALLVASIALFGCSPQNDFLRSELGSYRDYITIDGEIDNNVYASRNKKFPFSFEVPSLVRPGAVIKDQYNQKGGMLSFSDDVGNFIRIDFVSKNAFFYEGIEDKEIVKIMDHFMYKELYEPTDMNIKLIGKSIVDDKMFVIFDFPNGSTIALNGKRLNAIRGSLCFVREDVVFMLSRQSTETLSKNIAYNDTEEMKRMLFNDFKSFRYKNR